MLGLHLLPSFFLQSTKAITRHFRKPIKSCNMPKHISVEGNGHCCHRPSSNWETNQGYLISLDHINRYNTYTHIYTDGSKAENLVAAAYTIPTINLNKQLRLCNSSSIYAAELTAIKEAFLWISENEKQN